ncbi:hypothetical protein BU23DRAFT_515905 [Bimuria novae-zelandiae CBS 107.79]|uniref:Intracellular protein transport protein-like protein n=1 Tax=Bimuria novae-zelandiae CBS 107.79 TaxID=1447943 RepID=A0A6A5UV88_9PLEO|nr:hypothetical protein BU23DRAFT_515905 [Bimuria novae-zelandiae CBS 107.79]
MFQAPAKQTATDTISTLSGRLASATLLEDRRAAILGLRSFAKDYPASVASGALRDLIAALTKDAEDVDTLKVVLETLLALFHPNEQSPEASDEIALWLADEFTQREDNINILLGLLETDDFYSRQNSLLLLRAIHDARPERTQECILTGIGKVVATLDDPRDAIRTEALPLLNDLSRSSTELQKLIVFENAFDRIFNLIQADGSLTQGTIVVQDSLSLLANLVRFNTSNQTNFRELGHVAKLAALLPGGQKQKKARSSLEEDDWVSPQADKNLWGLLAILRMFLVRGSISTLPNQNAFVKHGILQQVVNMAFDPASPIPIKIESLNVCADMIRGNARLQQGFAQLQVRPIVEPVTNGATTPNEPAIAYIIDALLNLVLTPAANDMFDVRFAACECIKAYIFNHFQIKTHFLQRAIDGLAGDETANALTTLLTGPQGSQVIDPYRIWFAAVLVFHLIFDDREAKKKLMGVVEGDSERGEEVVTCIQTLTANLITSLQLDEDERITIAYLMLLSTWLFEDAAAVNDFLGEASSLQSLVQAIQRPGNDRTVVRGLCAALLGIIYEFSTKDSPVPRRDLQPLLTTKLGREKYLNAIAELRHHPDVRDFEVTPQTGASGGLLPSVFFDETFTDFLKDNFSRLSRAIDRDPVKEILQSDDGIDRDVVDSLRGQIDEKQQAIEQLQAEKLTLEQRVNQEQAERRKAEDSAQQQLHNIKRINEELHRNHENDTRKAEREHKQALLELENKYNLQINALNNKMQQATKESAVAVANTKREYEEKLRQENRSRGEIEQRLNASDRARQDADRAHQQVLESNRALEQKHRDEIAAIILEKDALETHIQESGARIQKLQNEKSALQSTIEKSTAEARDLHSTIAALKSEVQDLKTKVQDQTWKVKDAEEKLRKAETAVKEKEEARAAAQTELDDLFVMLGDLEEKRARDKKRLKELGEEVSEAEDEDDEDEDDE